MAAVGQDALVEQQLVHARILRLARARFNGESRCMRCALLVALAACGGSQVTTTEHPAADVTKLLPATLEATSPKEGDPRSVHVRVWADAGVRALPHWKEDITDEIDYANQLMTPLLGVKLVVDATKDWDRKGIDFHDAAKQLATVDDGKDVTWAIGYVGPGDIASKAMGELGDAPLLGHVIVVRAWNEPAETAALASKLPDLEASQKAEVLNAHKRHKQTVVLLHMIGQSLGAIAEADPAWIQNPSYAPKQSTWSDRNRDLIQLAIDQRLTGGTDQTIAHDLLEAIEKQDWGGWIASDKETVVASLRGVVALAKAGQTAGDIPPAAMESYDRIKGLAAHKQFAEALVELDNVLTAYPASANLLLLKCQILIAKSGVADKTTRAACARVSEIAPGDPQPHFVLGEALIVAGDIDGARKELAQAAGKIANLNLGQADAWRRLATIYMGMGALTWTEEALAAGKLENAPEAAVVESTRARYGVAKGTKLIKPAAEGPYVIGLKAASALIYANKYADAHKAFDALDRKWPNAPGTLAFRCDLAMREGNLGGAQAACSRALASDPNESWALYLSGVLALRNTSAAGTRAGIEKLKRAITVDPDLGQAWRALAKAYARAKDQAAIEQLGKDYAAKFGAPLPQ
jgi:tetratricopeptide (TPR) repeat protein